MTKIDKLLAEIEGRAEKATPGPWSHQGNGEVRADLENHINICDCGFNSKEAELDGEFIAHSRQDIPRLCQAVRKAVRWLKAECYCHRPHCKQPKDPFSECPCPCEACEALEAILKILSGEGEANGKVD